MSSFAADTTYEWRITWDDPTPLDQEFVDFCNEVIGDVSNGIGQFIATTVNQVPFMGWGRWEIVAGVRDPNWTPPNTSESWRSGYDDKLIGIRKLAWRSQSTFNGWEQDPYGNIIGMYQTSMKGMQRTLLPNSKCVHITFGDPDNPEGLALLEAIWRLERIRYGLEVVQGMGFEKSAGFIKFKVLEKLDSDAKALVRKAARALATAQEGNYITELMNKFEADIIDIPFASADAILSAIKYYSILMLQVFNMQWVAIASTAEGGAYSAMADASVMFLRTFNSMMGGFAKQTGIQLAEWLVRNNPKFSTITRYPELFATEIEKPVPLNELADFMTSFASIFPMYDDDIIAIRRKAGFLPEQPADDAEPINEPPDLTEDPIDENSTDPDPLDVTDEFEEIADEVLSLPLTFEDWAKESAPHYYATMHLGNVENLETAQQLANVIYAETDIETIPDITPAPLVTNEISWLRQQVEKLSTLFSKRDTQDISVNIPKSDVHIDSPVTVNIPEQPAPNVDVKLEIPKQQPPNVNIEGARIDVHVPEQPTPNVDVHIPAPNVLVDSPVHLHAPDTAPPPDIVINVPEQPAPEVTIENTIELPKLITEDTKVIRDSTGKITGSKSQAKFEK